MPLPYDIPSPAKRRGVEDVLLEQDDEDGVVSPPSPNLERRPRTTGAELEAAPAAAGGIRRRGTADDVADDEGVSPIQRGIARVGTILSAAHAQDFERRKRPGVVGRSPVGPVGGAGLDDDEEEEEEDDDDDEYGDDDDGEGDGDGEGNRGTGGGGGMSERRREREEAAEAQRDRQDVEIADDIIRRQRSRVGQPAGES